MNNIENLRRVDTRIRGLNIHNRNSSEHDRMVNIVRPDVLSKLSAEELHEYEASKVVSAADQERIRVSALAAMEQNKDSASI
jgi:hypothetical protein